MASTASMRIVVLGGSGHIGRVIVTEAAARGHAVTAVARDPGSLGHQKGTTVLAADVLDPSTMRQAVQGQDAVVGALSGHPPRPADTVPRAARMLLDVLPGVGVDRLLFVGGGATLERGPRGRFIDSPDFPEEYRQEAEADAEALSIFKHSGSGLKWSYLSPPPLNLVEGARTGIFRAEASEQPIMDGRGESRITVGDLAAAVVDAVENETFIRQRFTVAY